MASENDHQIVRNATITGLQDDTTYFMRILSSNDKGLNVSSDVWMFKTNKGNVCLKYAVESRAINLYNLRTTTSIFNTALYR